MEYFSKEQQEVILALRGEDSVEPRSIDEQPMSKKFNGINSTHIRFEIVIHFNSNP